MFPLEGEPLGGNFNELQDALIAHADQVEVESLERDAGEEGHFAQELAESAFCI